MISPTTVSMIRDLVAIFGVIAGFSYYVLTVRNAQRTRELTLKAQEHATETRETQIFMQLYQNLNNEDIYKKWAELVNQEKIEFNEYVEKYDSSFLGLRPNREIVPVTTFPTIPWLIIR